jgi:hypothetical protein
MAIKPLSAEKEGPTPCPSPLRLYEHARPIDQNIGNS